MNKLNIIATALLTSVSLGIHANTNPQQFKQYKPKVTAASEYAYYESDKTVAENKIHAVVRQDAGNSCAAGTFYLMNKKAKTYQPVDAGTCDDRDFSVQLNESQLVFKQNKRITALYPVYGN